MRVRSGSDVLRVVRVILHVEFTRSFKGVIVDFCFLINDTDKLENIKNVFKDI